MSRTHVEEVVDMLSQAESVVIVSFSVRINGDRSDNADPYSLGPRVRNGRGQSAIRNQ